MTRPGVRVTRRTIDLEQTVELPDGRDCHVRCRWTPVRPAPYCTNPDSPAFSDPGDPKEIEITSTSVQGSDGQWREIVMSDLQFAHLTNRLSEELNKPCNETDNPDEDYDPAEDV